MPPTRQTSRFLGATWSTFQPSLGLGPIEANRTAGAPLAAAFVEAKIVDSSECILRANIEVADLIDLLEQEAAKAEEALVVYICSHGLFPFAAPYRLATTRTKRPDDIGRSLVVSELLQVLTRSPARVKALLVDSCFAGQAAAALSDQVLNLGLQSPPECTVLAAASPLDVADSIGQRSDIPLFTEQLIQSLGELRSKASSTITFGQLYTLTQAKLKSLGAPTPRLYSANQSADIRLTRSGSGQQGVLLSTRPDPSVRVLYVDDGEAWRDDFEEAVGEPGVLVDLAADAAAARSLILTRHYDLIVIDLFLADDIPATDLIELLGQDVSNVEVFLVTRLGKGGAESWAQLDAIFRYPSGVSAVYFKNRGEHIANARRHLTDLLSQRRAVLNLAFGAPDAAAQVASRVSRRHPQGPAVSSLDSAEFARLEVETLALLHECLSPWLGDLESSYVDSFTIRPLGGGRSSSAVFALAPSLSDFADPPVAQLVLKVGLRSEIEEEVTRYDRYVQVGIPLSIRTDKISHVYGRRLGAVLYSFLGDTDDIEELGDASPETVCDGIAKVMSPINRRWYAAKSRQKINFLDYYERHQFGYDRFKRTITDCNGQLSQFRSQEGLPRPFLTDGLLDSEIVGGSTPAVLVHGDMHLGNLIHYGPDRYAIIDYRNLGIGPRLIDFASLEIDCWLRGATPGLSKADLFWSFIDVGRVVQLVTSRMPHTSTLDDLDGIIDASADELSRLPEWFAPRIRPILLCRRASFATFGVVEDQEYAAQLWLSSIRRWAFQSAWATADERRALRTAPLAIAVGCNEVLAGP